MLSKGIGNEKHFGLTGLSVTVVLIIISLRRTSLLLFFYLCSAIICVYKTAHDEVTFDMIGHAIKM